MTESPATAQGPSWRGLTIDWLYDRILGRPTEDGHRLVTATGEVLNLPRPGGS